MHIFRIPLSNLRIVNNENHGSPYRIYCTESQLIIHIYSIHRIFISIYQSSSYKKCVLFCAGYQALRAYTWIQRALQTYVTLCGRSERAHVKHRPTHTRSLRIACLFGSFLCHQSSYISPISSIALIQYNWIQFIGVAKIKCSFVLQNVSSRQSYFISSSMHKQRSTFPQENGELRKNWQENCRCCLQLHVTHKNSFNNQFDSNWFGFFIFSDAFTDPNVQKPQAPVMFLKPTTAYITEGQDIVVGFHA